MGDFIKKFTLKRLLAMLRAGLRSKPRLADLDHVSVDMVVASGQTKVIPAFVRAAEHLPFYRTILEEKGVERTRIRTLQDFSHMVPILSKEDIYPRFPMDALCWDGTLFDMQTAMVTSGTSGAFASSLSSKHDLQHQEAMVDDFLEYYFDAKTARPLILNALPMGVTFSSSYPVISTSVRADTVRYLIKTLEPYYRRILVVCDPHFAKHIIDEGCRLGFPWKEHAVSFVVGGTWLSDSLTQHLLKGLNDETAPLRNTLSLTMGVTEIGLNLFTAPPRLVEIRSLLQADQEALTRFFGPGTTVAPQLMYYYPTRTYVEIVSPDSNGIGRLVLSNLDTTVKTPLFRYATGDRGQFVNRPELIAWLEERGEEKELLNLPLIAIYDRGDQGVESRLSVAHVKEALYRESPLASRLSGHFEILPEQSRVRVQLGEGIAVEDADRLILEQQLKAVSGQAVTVELIAYHAYTRDMHLDHGKKWKHS